MNYLKLFDVEVRGNSDHEHCRCDFRESFCVEAEDAQEIIEKWEPSIQNLRWRKFVRVEEVLSNASID